MAKKKKSTPKKVAKKKGTPKKQSPARAKAANPAQAHGLGKHGYKFPQPPPIKTDEQLRVEKELRERRAELEPKRLKAEEVLLRHHAELLAHPGVRGLHVGLRRKGRRKPGKIAFPLEYCIQVSVAKKWKVGHPRLLKSLELGSTIDGVPVDVIERTYSFAQANGANPIRGGIQINSSADIKSFGTLGIVVFSAGAPLYLTNQHVVGAPGNSIMHPANGLVIGTVLDSERNGSIDAAVIKPNENGQPAFGILMPDNITVLPTPVLSTLTSSDVSLTQCFKIGAKTGGDPSQTGTVESITATVPVDGQPPMMNQITVVPPAGVNFIDHGDSGSLLLVPAADANRAVGLVWAVGGDGSLVACPLDQVLARFNNATLTNV